ncbi:MAG: 4Fe-4S dicluster domain-containing protein [Synergistales bacterium]|nr:4Fe-4S dicluster domain-containing protein [Synergistales bacterium]
MEHVLLLSPEKCIGCGSCELACAMVKEGEFRPALSRVSVYRFEGGVNVPMTCQQCDDAPCMNVCKVGALSRDENNVVVVDPEKCIGCRMCVHACPFGNMAYHREKKVAIKCDQCGGEPQCVAFCPTKALEYLPADTVTLARKKLFSQKFAKIAQEVTN